MKSKNGKPLVIFILIPLLLISCASAPKYRISMETLEDFEQTVIALGFGRTWNQHVYITAVLQGRSYRLLLDTGFYGVLGLKPDVLDELNLPVVGEVTYRDAEGTMYHAREVVVPAVQIGDLQFTELRAQEDFYGPEEFDGQIGLGLLTHFDVLMDYRSRSMTLYPRSHQLEGVDSGIWFGAALVEGLNIRIRMSPSAES